jgi:RNA polymerase-binding transcription factor DksA
VSARCVTEAEPCSDAGAELEGESSTMAKTTKKTTKADTPDKAGKAEAGDKAKPAGKNPFPKKFIEQQKALLVAERARYIKSADALKAEADALMNEREPGDVQFDEESGEGDSLAVERERDLALSAQARAAVELIDAALGRIEAGTYGICVHSGEPIPQERLEAIPWAAERVEFKTGSFRS